MAGEGRSLDLGGPPRAHPVPQDRSHPGPVTLWESLSVPPSMFSWSKRRGTRRAERRAGIALYPPQTAGTDFQKEEAELQGGKGGV